MLLNNETFNRVKNLFPSMPYTSATYCGCWSAGTVNFAIGCTDQYGNYKAGIEVTISQEFKILKVKRLFTTWGTRSKKLPTVTEKIPIHPAGQKPLLYVLCDSDRKNMPDISKYGARFNY